MACMSVSLYTYVSLVNFVSAQISNHMDFQKVGEVTFKNEQYNVLRPTVHKVTDHFKDFMLRSENQHPDERIFIDDNGFRHFWSGFGKRTENVKNKMNNDDVTTKSTAKYETGTLMSRKNTEKEEGIKESDSEAALRQAGKKTAKLSFFCPFFGIITMTSNVD